MFKTFFFSELKYVLKQPMVYIFLGIITLLVFGATASDSVTIGGSVGNVYRNAPHVITVFTTVLTIFGLLIATAFFNNAALRDYSSDFNEILFSTPLSKSGYFFGRFFSALILATIPMLGVFIGVYLGTILAPAFGWISADRFGPIFLKTFVNNYFLFILPNMFFAGSIIFVMANKWKSTVISFLGTLIIIIAYITSGTLMSDISNQKLAALTDIFGVRAYSYFSRYYTTIESNTISPSFTGILLYNRLIWISLGLIILILAYFSFSFKEKNKKVKVIKETNNEEEKIVSIPQIHTVFNRKTEWLQFKSFFITNFLNIIKSVTFKILFLFSVIILITNFIGGFEYFGLKSYPVTYKMIDTIQGSSSIFVIIILVFYSGELIWRDRESKINEVIDATPHTSLISLIAKAFSLVSISTLLYFFFIFCAIIYQLLNGYTKLELNVYFLDFFYSSFFDYIILSCVFILFQTVFNNKYLGYFVSILVVFLLSLILSIFHIQSNMLLIGEGPSIFYSDMNGFGPGLTGAMWFNLYWFLFAMICLIVAGMLWNRGVLSSLKDKIKYAKKRLPANYKFVLMGCIIAWLLTAGFVFYNTQILNPYKTSKQIEKLQVKYEQKYKRFEHIILPKITDAKYFIDIYPKKRDVMVKAILQLTNESNKPIDSVHFLIDDDWKTEIDIPNTKLAYEDKELGYRIYVFNQPMLPNAQIEATIHTSFISKGFENGAGNTNIVENGTFLNNFEILPYIGYDANREISDPNTRKNIIFPLKKECLR